MKKPLLFPFNTIQHLALLMLICIVFSCSSKKADPTPKTKTSAELITQASWHWTGEQYKNPGTVDQPLTDVQKSDTYTYKADGSFTVSRSGTAITTGTWLISADNQFTLNFTDDTGTPVTQTVPITVSETAFVWTLTGTFHYTDSSGITTTYTTKVATYTH